MRQDESVLKRKDSYIKRMNLKTKKSTNNFFI